MLLDKGRCRMHCNLPDQIFCLEMSGSLKPMDQKAQVLSVKQKQVQVRVGQL